MAKEPRSKFVRVLPGKRLLATLVVVFCIAYIVMVLEDRKHQALQGANIWLAAVAGIAFALPAFGKALDVQAKWKDWKPYPFLLSGLVILVGCVATVTGIVIGVHTSGSNWARSVAGFEAYFALMASLFLLDDIDKVTIGRSKSPPTKK